MMGLDSMGINDVIVHRFQDHETSQVLDMHNTSQHGRKLELYSHHQTRAPMDFALHAQLSLKTELESHLGALAA